MVLVDARLEKCSLTAAVMDRMRLDQAPAVYMICCDICEGTWRHIWTEHAGRRETNAEENERMKAK